MGIADVARFAASVAGVPRVRIRSTLDPTSSAASGAKRSVRPFGRAVGDDQARPLDVAALRHALAEAVELGVGAQHRGFQHADAQRAAFLLGARGERREAQQAQQIAAGGHDSLR
jgi:hypothetical protein